jgi:UDP-2-acetamido-3-amino-2,3-dideoxy-glucuronate N-acetyltransferase
VFTNVINPRAFVERKDEYKQTLVKRGASIGANATIVCGATLGRYCFVGAGSVVTTDVADYALVYGSPARLHGWVCQCGTKLDADLRCPECSRQYETTDHGLQEKD